MNTVLQARPRNFVSTPTLERTTLRALRYLQSGYSIHLKGPAGTGKTTLALHLADLLARPIMLLFGDDEFKTSDLIGNQSGYTRKKVVDNYIHSVMKVEDELRQNWTDSRLTLACREGFTMVYDEFNRSRPEVNNVLLSALEEKLLVLPPSNNRAEYIRVSPHFRAILTSNPEEYCGVHGTQDALQDRLITINMPEPDELAQQQILVQKVGIDSSAALQIVQLVKAFQSSAAPDMVSSLRPSLMIATICHDHGILPLAENADFRDVCSDILLARSKEPAPAATRHLWNLFNRFVVSQATLVNDLTLKPETQPAARLHGEEEHEAPAAPLEASLENLVENEAVDLDAAEGGLVSTEPGESTLTQNQPEPDVAIATPTVATIERPAEVEPAVTTESSSVESSLGDDFETRIFDYLDATGTASLATIEAALGLTRFQVVTALKSMLDQALIEKHEVEGQLTGYQLSSN
ncbi:gas vesicle protein GvpN [Nodosilinea sp. LEGE 06152]|uniref:gas vesicle protein GvpN n=1 Tax=Nodosilinea sp. LEGE 06152 TaxID=2777966 RepID=UPI00187FE253|nr:gas vesicle protein GvpN [Nodosilinea sp. LEGE 06152]